MNRVLIIKLGYRRGLSSVVSRDVSLASVLKATVTLNLFGGDEVVWLTTPAAVPLVSGAPNVRQVLAYDPVVSRQLSSESFEVVVNLEPAWEFCALAESVHATLRFGFALDDSDRRVVALPGADAALALETSRTAQRRETHPYQQILYQLMGKDWQGEPLLLGYRPNSREEFDLGFNLSVESAWENKAWPHSYWQRLEELTLGRYSISYEHGTRNLQTYIEWVHSCRILVTADTFGLYLALALGKKVVALFGPTSASRCHTYGRGIKLVPSVKLNCIPCADLECAWGKSCVETITPEQVAEAVDVISQAAVLEK